eukprot:TRINITY_DN9111_c0_g1_i1.p2 TRINITY_DN9111_c0_g1~~TRINITY_DN9111_c0_g1_i1.p2  ORF type:complete len:169 (+),score=46.29 TRINITY_DN9111_c0_g1_i1:797-1303(+)
MLIENNRPADKYLSHSVQKIEKDVHACDHRWSRGTRVFFNEKPTLNKLSDLIEIFPPLATLNRRIDPDVDLLQSTNMNVFYWQASAMHVLPCGLKFKSTFTFMYKTIEDAFSGEVMAKKDGEWSFRLYAGLEGYSHKFVQQHLETVDDFFYKLALSEWNSDVEIDCLL